MAVTLIEVDYPASPPGSRWETPFTWEEIRVRLIGAGPSPWLTARSLRDDTSRVQILNLNRALRVRLIDERPEEVF